MYINNLNDELCVFVISRIIDTWIVGIYFKYAEVIGILKIAI